MKRFVPSSEGQVELGETFGLNLRGISSRDAANILDKKLEIEIRSNLREKAKKFPQGTRVLYCGRRAGVVVSPPHPCGTVTVQWRDTGRKNAVNPQTLDLYED